MGGNASLPISVHFSGDVVVGSEPVGIVRYDGKVPHELKGPTDITLHLVCVESISHGPRRTKSKPQSHTLRDVPVPLRDLTVMTIHPGHSVEFRAPALPVDGPDAWPDSFQATGPAPGYDTDHRHESHIRVQYFVYVGSKALAAKSELAPFKFYPAPSPTPSPPVQKASEDVQPPDPLCFFCKAESVQMELTMPTVVVTGKDCKVAAKCEGNAKEVTFSLHQVLTLREEGKKETKLHKVISKASVHEAIMKDMGGRTVAGAVDGEGVLEGSPNLVLAYSGTLFDVSHFLRVNVIVGGFGGTPPAFEYEIKAEVDSAYRKRVSAIRNEVKKEMKERKVGPGH